MGWMVGWKGMSHSQNDKFEELDDGGYTQILGGDGTLDEALTSLPVC